MKIQLEREILLGQSAQDVTTALGAPSKVFYKSEDKMRIHSSNAFRKTPTAIKSDYFFNYFTLGLVSVIQSRFADRIIFSSLNKFYLEIINMGKPYVCLQRNTSTFYKSIVTG